ncbi:DUF721 domain-containing protein [Vibrio crassostreae]|uniref:hypothetical protein n=1 Tax=Vibrio crassostreae TaxID=246167 RepID=UPI001052F4DD|nr:hypothetical protein [Vibrio crassostreae]TCU01419.1 hypothetical protein EDB47_11890 [Vibrio crassostreae]CAK2342793.1 DUF721 domain-containing protein [Vibrio crassostreae]CAK2813880.1 DUF721 domain-containing protein [Vibrio crassostreae]CAK2897866.1 DUF721 domain-containing protein [Vibrio crassostreae]CAK3563538.1 DUF721 domain-containing protein [Vibrio crassostreae]
MRATTSLCDVFQDTTFAAVKDKLQAIAEINQQFHEQFPHYGKQLRVANVNGGSIAIEAPNSMVLTRLKFDKQQILAWAEKVDSRITNLKLSVNPTLYR